MLSWIDIDGARLKSNIEAFRNLIAPGISLMIVVKANAYGHGLETVTPLVAEAADWLGVNSIDEAMRITAAGVTRPVTILGHTDKEEVEDVVRNGYRQVLYRLDVAKAISETACRMQTTARIHLK